MGITALIWFVPARGEFYGENLLALQDLLVRRCASNAAVSSIINSLLIHDSGLSSLWC